MEEKDKATNRKTVFPMKQVLYVYPHFGIYNYPIINEIQEKRSIILPGTLLVFKIFLNKNSSNENTEDFINKIKSKRGHNFCS